MSHREVAQTILTQLRYGQDRTIKVMSWGAHNWMAGEDKESNLGFLRFNVQGHHFKGIVKIALAFNDTYTVEFIKVSKKKDAEMSELLGRTKFKTTSETVETWTDVYFDELTERIDEYVEKIDDYTY